MTNQTDKDKAAADKAADAVAKEEAPESLARETVPGGRYITNDGRTVNAEGQELDKHGKVKE